MLTYSTLSDSVIRVYKEGQFLMDRDVPTGVMDMLLGATDSDLVDYLLFVLVVPYSGN